MRLKEMGSKPSAKKLNRVVETRFGYALDFDKLTFKKAYKLASGLTESLDSIRRSHGAGAVEKNPQYMEMLMVRESIHSWMRENHSRFIAESELAKSEAILAAKNIVDSIQDMLEKISKLQSEQMPALLDSIRDQVGAEQADGFKNAVGSTLETLMGNLQTAREGVDNGVRILTGEQVDNPMSLPGDDLGGELPPPPGSDLDADETDGFGATDAAVGGAEELGREKR